MSARPRRTLVLIALILCAWIFPVHARFDPQHAVWSGLLSKHVLLMEGGKASQVRYSGLAQERAVLKGYLDSLARVEESEFRSWDRHTQLAFLLNAYNAHMVDLVLTRHPKIESVWDFGKILNNPFKLRFFRLFGRDFSLDLLEHGTIRAPGAYDDPRIHMAVNCASVGCPMLREEAYTGEKLERQLEEQVTRFLSDRSRNRYNPATGALEVSEIFRWYREDFESGYRGIRNPQQFFARYAALLTDSPQHQAAIRTEKVTLRYLPYDWRLNGTRNER